MPHAVSGNRLTLGIHELFAVEGPHDPLHVVGLRMARDEALDELAADERRDRGAVHDLIEQRLEILRAVIVEEVVRRKCARIARVGLGTNGGRGDGRVGD